MTLIKRKMPNLTDFFNDSWSVTNWDREANLPAVNVVENEDNFEIDLAAPGFKKEEIHVNVTNGVLSIDGSTEKEEEERKKNYTRREFSSKSFSRTFTLPKDVIEEDVKAKFKDGVLSLKLMKEKNTITTGREIVVE